MLKSVDILIGLSVVMLIVSMAVTLLTQAMLALRQSRGKHLLAGLVDLLEQLDPGMKRRYAEEIAKMILRNPILNGGKIFGSIRLGEVIHREELTKMLLDLAGRDPKDETLTELQQMAIKTLKDVMANNGITNPDETLKKVHMAALTLEKSNPELAHDVRQNIALLQEAASQFLAKINLQFDSVIDRVRERFTFSARGWTFISATIVAVVLQLDTVTLINRFAMDDAMRAAFVEEAMKVHQVQAVVASVGDHTAALTPTAVETQRHYLTFLAKQGVILPPASIKLWYDNWQNVNPPGLIVSILLLSLGAPFWYSVLNRLLHLRSVLAQKDDVQRVTRNTTQPSGDISDRGTGTAGNNSHSNVP
ncbi:kinetochore Spc7 family protein [Methylocaldum szegediense]|uniref:Uncharacterized protein n=1 Tax=Methylocaldum szegediense TaxID=73780 RepID=A0ABN8X6W7_9GAMM|nr:hypothetical protein [Methylocaldum szegediense]CAI8860729.1 conserved membrane protein of unknown function [Methylocaldum szegediense]